MNNPFKWFDADIDDKTEITVAMGSCTAIRPKVLTALKPYGVVVHRIEAWGEKTELDKRGEFIDVNTSDDDITAARHFAKITVNTAAAEWVEYLLLRSKQYLLMSKPINPKNERWAAQWDKMPRGWQQAGCTDGAQSEQGRRQQQRPTAAAKRKQQQPQRRRGRGSIFGGLLDW